MILKHLSELTWEIYSGGQPNVNELQFVEADIRQFLKLAVSNIVRRAYYDSKKMDEWGEPDYAIVSPMFSIQRLPLTDTDVNGKRSVDVSGFDFYRLPKNAHFTNIYPVNNKCEGQQLKSLSQVSPGEEYFYIGKPKFNGFLFYTIKGKSIDTYNLPYCVENVDVESTFDSDQVDVAMDIAYDASVFVLNMSLGIKGRYDPEMLRKQLMKEQNLK